jgi:hypothetical protein
MKHGVRAAFPRRQSAWRWTAALVVTTSLAIALGCGGERTFTDGLGPPSVDPIETIELLPAMVSLEVAESRRFTVTLLRRSGVREPAGASLYGTGGSLAPDGTFTAGSSPGRFRVVASFENFADTADVEVLNPITSLRLSPATVETYPTRTAYFKACARRSNGSESAISAAFSTSGGSVDAAGHYSAGVTPGSFPVIASKDGVADTAWVTILDPSIPANPPDLVDLDFDSGDYGAVSNFPQATPRHRASATGGIGSTPALEAVWQPGATDYSPARVRFPAGAHRFVSASFRLTAPMLHSTSNTKVFRFSDPNRGGIFSNNSQAWGFGFDQEASSVVAAIGVFESAAPSAYLTEVGSQYVYGEHIADDTWHTLEIEYDRDAPGGRVEARLWFDGRPIVMPASDSRGAWAADGYWWSQFQWSGGVAGVYPSTLSVTRSGGSTTDTFGLVEEMSGTILNSGSLFLDKIAISTERIGR